jgi:hypothetical protein
LSTLVRHAEHRPAPRPAPAGGPMRWLAIAIVTLAPICAAAEPASQPGSSFESVARRWRARLPALPSLAIKMRCPADPDGVPDATHTGADTGPGPQIALRIGGVRVLLGSRGVLEFAQTRIRDRVMTNVKRIQHVMLAVLADFATWWAVFLCSGLGPVWRAIPTSVVDRARA